MEDVSTAKLNAWLSGKLADEANSAELILVSALKNCILFLDKPLAAGLSCMLSAVLIKAGEAFLLATKSTTCVSTWQDLMTIILDSLSALWFEANIIKGCFLFELDSSLFFLFLDDFTAESALWTGKVDSALLTSPALMVWILVTFRAEVLLTEMASYSVLCHVLTSIWLHLSSFVIFQIVVWLAWNDFHHTTTLAFDDFSLVLVLLVEHFHLLFLDLLEFFWQKHSFHLKTAYIHVALWAFQWLVIDECLDGSLLEAAQVDDMEAICRLEKHLWLVLLDALHAELADVAWLFHQLHINLDSFFWSFI